MRLRSRFILFFAHGFPVILAPFVEKFTFSSLNCFYISVKNFLLFSHKSWPTLCDPMSTPGFPVLHHLLELEQTHALWVGDAIQPFHPLSPPSPPALNLFQHQGLQKLDRHICFSVLFHWYMCSLFCSIDRCVCSSSSTVLCWYCTYVESLNRRMIPPIVPSLTKLS